MSIPDFERAEYLATAPPPPPAEIFVSASTAGAFPRAILYGLGGAILGSLIYALVGLWIEIGFISILVGAMVGNGMMKGSGGIGGRRYQIAAVVLTYFAVSFAFVLDTIWQESRKGSFNLEHNGLLLLVLLLLGPFLQLAGSVGGGLLSLLILFFGMQSAWKTARGGPRLIMQREPQPDGSLGLR